MIRIRIEHDNDYFDVSYEDSKQRQAAHVLKAIGVSLDHYSIDETLMQIREVFNTPQVRELVAAGWQPKEPL